MKTSIIKSEYLQLLGLAILANQHSKALAEIVNACEQIVGEEAPRCGHCADEIYGHEPSNIDDLLRRLKIKVEQ